MSESEWWTVPEAAKHLKVSENAVYAGIQTGRLPALQIGTRFRLAPAALAKLGIPMWEADEDVADAPVVTRRRRVRPKIAASIRFRVLERDGFTCTYCGRKPPDVVLHVDHVHPVAAGGTTTMDNLRTACQDCNLGKAARILEAVT